MSLLDTQRGFRDHILAGVDAPLRGAPVWRSIAMPIARS
jgi:hypothetical protein